MRNPLFPIALAAVLLGSGVSASAKDIDMTPVKKWIERQSKVKTVVANFTQERKLRTVKKPLKSSGKLWYIAPGTFRWEVGSPPKLIAVQKNKSDLKILRPKRKKAEVHSYKELADKGSEQGISFFEAGFPRSVREFEKNFTVTGIEKTGEFYMVSAKLKSRKQSLALRKIVFYLWEKNYMLHTLRLYFRDTSQISSTITQVKENVKIPSSSFEVDLTGYKVETKK